MSRRSGRVIQDDYVITCHVHSWSGPGDYRSHFRLNAGYVRVAVLSLRALCNYAFEPVGAVACWSSLGVGALSLAAQASISPGQDTSPLRAQSLPTVPSGLAPVCEPLPNSGRSPDAWLSAPSVSLHSLHTHNDRHLSTLALFTQLQLLRVDKTPSCNPNTGSYLSAPTGQLHLLSCGLCPPGEEREQNGHVFFQERHWSF